jgi:hypothetical protein
MTQNTLVDLVYETIDNPDKRSDLVAAFAEVIDAKAAAIAFEDRRLRLYPDRVILSAPV